MPTRKENFMTAMKNNADVKKRFGGDVNKAYEAMRRNVDSKTNRAGKINSDEKGIKSSAISRRLDVLKDDKNKYANTSGWDRPSVKDIANKGTVFTDIAGRRNKDGKTLGDQFRSDRRFEDSKGKSLGERLGDSNVLGIKGRRANNDRIAKNQQAPKKSAIERRLSGR